MSKVHNWQLGRAMDYPYEAAYPDRQFAFVFNINRCIGCQTCTMACKSTWTFSKGQEQMWWANVETKPYGGYPHGWDVKILELLDRANPGKQNWAGDLADNRTAPYGQFDGLSVFEAAQRSLTPDSARVLGYLPPDTDWNSPNIYEDNPVGERGKPLEFSRTGERLPVLMIWFLLLEVICLVL
jgi:nitrate reductase beta subunit